jgi:succinate dehydrogenase / fumarate reductase iron-sulfur subunit
MSEKHITVHLKVWRQAARDLPGRLVDYVAKNVSTDMSFLEMLDVVNEDLIRKGEDAIAFDSDCREGICGACGCLINGIAHGPDAGTTTCQLHMRRFTDGQTIVVEPWRAKAFPVLKDLSVDRSALDRIVAAGGYISAGVGGAQDANSILVPKEQSDSAMDSAHLFTGAKVAHLALLPQGGPERELRAVRMVEQMEAEGFGNCSNEGECEAVCPKLIPISNIARMVREYTRAVWKGF